MHRTRMPNLMLQNHNCVASLQHRLAYNVVMGPIANEYCSGPVESKRRATNPRRDTKVRRTSLVLAALLGCQ